MTQEKGINKFQDDYNVPQYFTPAQLKIIQAPVPSEFIYDFNGFNYINLMVVVDILNRAFGHAWSWYVDEEWVGEIRDFYKKKKKSNYYQDNSAPEPVKDPDKKNSFIWIRGRLVVPGTDPYTRQRVEITKTAYGSVAIASEDARTQGQNMKGASSDGLKKAASLLGIASNVYTKPDLYKHLQTEKVKSDSWTPDKNHYLKLYIEMMGRLKQDYGQEQMQKYINNFCDETQCYTTFGQITPSNIIKFMNYMDREGLLPVA